MARADITRTSGTVSRLGRTASRTGRLLGAAFAVGSIARAAVAVGKVGAGYVDSLNKIQALTGSTDASLSRIARRLESQASVYAKFGQTTGDAAAGMVELTKSGLSARKALGAIRGTMILAKAGELEVADASELVANTLNTFSLKASKASKIANGLANAANISSANVTDLAESFKYAAPLAAKAGLPLDQVNAILAELSNSGIKASQAGTSLRGILLALQAPSTAGATALEDLGVRVYDARGRMRDFGDLLEDLRKGLGRLSDEGRNSALKSIFGRNAITGAQVLLKGGRQALDEYTAGVRRAGAAQALAESSSRGLAGTINQIKAAATSTAQALYRIYSPVIDRALRTALEFATKHKKVLIPALAGAAAAAAGAAAALGAIALVTSPTALAVSAVVGLGAAVSVAYKRSETFRNAVAATADALRSFGGYLQGTVLPAVTRTAREIAQRLQPVLAQAGQTFRSDIAPALAQVAAQFREWQPTIRRVAETAGRLTAQVLIFQAKLSGKVIPVLIRLGGIMARTNIPVALRLADALVKLTAANMRTGAAMLAAGQKAARFAAAVRSKFNDAIAFMTTVPGRIKGALGDLSNILYAAGRSVISGLISGIVDKAQDLWNTLAGITSKIPLHKGPPARDRKLLRGTGRLIMAGLIRGIDDGSEGIKRALERITQLIQKRLDGKKQADRRKSLLKSLKDEGAALRANGKLQDAVARALEKATSRYKDLIRTSREYAASVKAGFQSYGSVVGLGTTGGGTAVTLPALLSQLAARASVADQFTAIIEKLKSRLNKTSLKQLLDQAAQGDLEGALATAQAIASGGPAAVAQINALTAQIGKAGGKLGDSAAASLFAAGIRAAEGFAKGLKRQERRLDQTADRMADRLVDRIRTQLGIGKTSAPRTPAPRFSASDTYAGRTPAYDAYMRQAARPSSGGDVHITLNVQAPVGSSSQDIGRTLTKHLDAYFGAGGRRHTRWA
ncbi:MULTISPECIES: phage tail tape measure protein [unclassified Nocardioides]|uniref:phage tail tape measure protein n=1 Tax=unclassified Nocardioides TaxID=2615069 RepID=UPI00005705C0|nr:MULTISPECIES: phage tail tape measure protein [unclassified Nocardioides]ABL80092.1 phage tail tape measure protein, TP901 family [Nocardioides sp. JS614]